MTSQPLRGRCHSMRGRRGMMEARPTQRVAIGPHSRFGTIICLLIGGDGRLSFRIRGSKGIDELVDFASYIVPHGFRKVRFADVPDDV